MKKLLILFLAAVFILAGCTESIKMKPASDDEKWLIYEQAYTAAVEHQSSLLPSDQEFLLESTKAAKGDRGFITEAIVRLVPLLIDIIFDCDNGIIDQKTKRDMDPAK